MAKSKIQWTDETDNVFVVKGEDGNPHGWYCEKVSEGCQFCYAERLNGTPFYGGNGLTYTRPSKWQDMPEMMIRRDILDGWLTKKAPKRRFVNSMTDTFGEFIPDEWLDALFAHMALSPTQTFQVLTKRAKRMFQYFNSFGVESRIERYMKMFCFARGCLPPADLAWPLTNVWLGVSVENQARAEERIPHLLQTPAAVRFLSVEPLLGPVDLWKFAKAEETFGSMYDHRQSYAFHRTYSGNPDPSPVRVVDGIDWVIVGGESGPNARPMHPMWVRDVRDQCEAAQVPFFFKQWGEWAPDCLCKGKKPCRAIPRPKGTPNGVMFRCGKHKAGRVLDGRTWDEFPQFNHPTPIPSPSKTTERGA